MPTLLYQSEPTPDDQVRALLNSKDTQSKTLLKVTLTREQAKDRVIADYKEDRMRGSWRLFSIVDDDDEVAEMTNEVVREDKKGVIPEAKLTQIRQAHGNRTR